MNYRVIGWVLAWVLKVEGSLMLVPCFIALIYRDRQGLIYLALALLAIVAGNILARRKPANMEIYQKEGYVSVGLSWILISLYGAIPFVLTGEIPNFVDAVFEVASGVTTTGSSILTDVEALCHTSLFWRSFTHWSGGMGVLVFLLMLIPAGGGSHMNLMKAESPGYEVSKFVPRVRNNAITLYKIYLALTVATFAALLLTGMYWFDSICIAFGAAGTGGFGILNSSCAAYTATQQWIITFAMIAFGVNFTFYYLCLIHHSRDAFRMEEVRAYLLIILGAGLLITWNIHQALPQQFTSWGEALRHAFFQVGTIITTTGFSTVDFDVWPAFSKMILFLLMICGACAGSTGGGVKVSRILIILKSTRQELYSIVHPRSVRKIRMDDNSISDRTLRSLYIYMMTYFMIFGISVLLITMDGFDFETNVSAIAATLNNIGPGFSKVGPACNYSMFSNFSKIVMIFDMWIGRLEILPILILLYPRTWKRRG
uniref:Trk-type K+ transport system, membrane component n=1 Tax=Eubacterium cellulosolvens (strain ATCC 43171 / JCM 9499 / 6) TaxID=633697 RepID=I5AT87_EUBC6